MVRSLILCYATLLAASSLAGEQDAAWQVHSSPGAVVELKDAGAQIQAELNTYAHISKALGRDNVTASARIKPSDPAGVSWCTSLFLVWGAGDWVQMGMIDAAPDGRYYAVETMNGATTETYLDPCDLAESHFVRIQLGADCIRYLASDDGRSWRRLRTIERPPNFAGPAARLVAGKGYGRGAAPYPNPDLDNDYSDRGPRVTSSVSDIRVEPTPASQLRLTPSEKRKAGEADLDPVGRIVLRGKADPTYEQVSRFYPAMKLPREALGVPEHPTDIVVDHLGRLMLNWDQPPVAWIEAGDPPFPFGDEETPIKRKLMDGCIPVLTLTTKRGGIEYEQTVFGWSEGFSPDAALHAYVRLRARGDTLPDKAALAYGDKRAEFAMTRTKPGLAEICLRFAFPNPAGASQVASGEFEGKLANAKAFWKREIDKAAPFDLPDRRVNEAYRAWIAYSRLLVDKVNGAYEPHDGAGFYEQNYGYSALLHCIALDLYGMHDRAELYLGSILRFQRPDGLYTQNFGLPDQGMLLAALAEHYSLTGDAAWLRRISPSIVKAGDWLIAQRGSPVFRDFGSNAPGKPDLTEIPKHPLTKGLIKFRPYCDYADPEFNYMSDACCCVGLEKAAAALKSIGMSEEAERFRLEARRYRADILASMDAAAVRRAGRTMLPMAPQTHRLLKANGYSGGEYYGLVASCLLDSGFLPASDKRAWWITDLMEQKRGLTAGLCRFGPGGVDHAYTCGYLLTQLKRGDARRVLLGFWAMLAYGMTRDTYSGIECTTLTTGTNYWTLPHLYSCTQQLRLLRDMILREDGDTLRIGDAIPRAWLEDGKKIAVRAAPTAFGDVSFTISSRVRTGLISIRLSPPTRVPPGSIRIALRHPGSAPIGAVYVNGRPWKRFTGEAIELGGPREPVDLRVVYR